MDKIFAKNGLTFCFSSGFPKDLQRGGSLEPLLRVFCVPPQLEEQWNSLNYRGFSFSILFLISLSLNKFVS